MSLPPFFLHLSDGKRDVAPWTSVGLMSDRLLRAQAFDCAPIVGRLVDVSARRHAATFQVIEGGYRKHSRQRSAIIIRL